VDKQRLKVHFSLTSLMAALVFLGCGTPSVVVPEPRPAALPFESLAFYNSLVHGPQPELDQPQGIGSDAAAVETGTDKSR
jgi:hypothetical protein